MKSPKPITELQALHYEIHSSRLARVADRWPPFLRGVIANYYASRTRRKMGRYCASLAERDRVTARGVL